MAPLPYFSHNLTFEALCESILINLFEKTKQSPTSQVFNASSSTKFHKDAALLAPIFINLSTNPFI
jgi:hypothetical protein